MINIKDISILNQLSTDYLMVKFDIEDTDEPLTDYVFGVYRSLYPEDDTTYEPIVDSLTDFQYQDTTVNLLRYDVNYYYKIRVTNTNTGESVLSSSYGHLYNIQPDPISAISLYESQKLLEMLDNDPVYVLLRRRSGTRCPACWDSIRKQSNISNCQVCYGTGYSPGYSVPISTRISYMSPISPEQFVVSSDRVAVEESPINAWISNYPIVVPGDIIVDSKYNYRYLINGLQPIKRNYKFLLRQIVTMQKLPPSNIIYKLSI